MQPRASSFAGLCTANSSLRVRLLTLSAEMKLKRKGHRFNTVVETKHGLQMLLDAVTELGSFSSIAGTLEGCVA